MVNLRLCFHQEKTNIFLFTTHQFTICSVEQCKRNWSLLKQRTSNMFLLPVLSHFSEDSLVTILFNALQKKCLNLNATILCPMVCVRTQCPSHTHTQDFLSSSRWWWWLLLWVDKPKPQQSKSVSCNGIFCPLSLWPWVTLIFKEVTALCWYYFWFNFSQAQKCC